MNISGQDFIYGAPPSVLDCKIAGTDLVSARVLRRFRRVLLWT